MREGVNMFLTNKAPKGRSRNFNLLKFRLGVLGDFPLTSSCDVRYFFEEREKMLSHCPTCYFTEPP